MPPQPGQKVPNLQRLVSRMKVRSDDDVSDAMASICLIRQQGKQRPEDALPILYCHDKAAVSKILDSSVLASWQAPEESFLVQL